VTKGSDTFRTNAMLISGFVSCNQQYRRADYANNECSIAVGIISENER
jgi:hypothetical protein